MPGEDLHLSDLACSQAHSPGVHATKLTVSFPGYGQKKLVEKYAGLQQDS